LQDLDIATYFDAQSSLDVISKALDQLNMQRADFGAIGNRLETTISNLQNIANNTNAAKSRIEDADFAVESARLAKAQVLQQSGTAMLAQANASSQLALQLVK
jgi:flagellin